MAEAELVNRLAAIAGRDGVLTSPEDLVSYSYDGTFVEIRPDLVVLPRSTEEVSRVVKLAG